jgi:hypothetical protein
MIRDGMKVSMDHFDPIRDGFFPIHHHLNLKEAKTSFTRQESVIVINR